MWKIKATVTLTDATTRELSTECNDREEVEDFVWRCLDFPATAAITFTVQNPPFENRDRADMR